MTNLDHQRGINFFLEIPMDSLIFLTPFELSSNNRAISKDSVSIFFSSFQLLKCPTRNSVSCFSFMTDSTNSLTSGGPTKIRRPLSFFSKSANLSANHARRLLYSFSFDITNLTANLDFASIPLGVKRYT